MVAQSVFSKLWHVSKCRTFTRQKPDRLMIVSIWKEDLPTLASRTSLFFALVQNQLTYDVLLLKDIVTWMMENFARSG